MAHPTKDDATGASIESEDKGTPPALPHPFRLARVEKIDAPEGGEGGDWYRYVIQSGVSTITGQRRGSLEDVTAYAEQSAEQFNARGQKSRSTWVSRTKKTG